MSPDQSTDFRQCSQGPSLTRRGEPWIPHECHARDCQKIVVRVDKAIPRFEFEIIDAYIVRVIRIKCTTGVMDTVFFSIDTEFVQVIIIPAHGNLDDVVELSQRRAA